MPNLNLSKLLKNKKLRSNFGKINTSGNNEKIKYAAMLFKKFNKNIIIVAKRVDIANITDHEINLSLKKIENVNTKKYAKKMELKIIKIIGKKQKFIIKYPKKSVNKEIEKKAEEILVI